MTAYGTVEQAVEAMKLGAIDYLPKPFEVKTLLDRIQRCLPYRDLTDAEVVAEDVRTRDIVELARKVARSDVTVLIGGESGTGKEVLARFVHAQSARVDGPFVAINCAAIPENMLEAVLFGYEKGAFTGALRANAGKFEQAQGGTLLLDEISEMSLPLQAKLLRVLQEREVERLGGRELIQLDVRVLTTTNRRLREEVAAGRFREDLFYRLNVFPLVLPPLRTRPRDILPLARHLLYRRAEAGQRPASLTPAAEAKLLGHAWPGNVRELDNVMQRAAILCEGMAIEPEHLQFEPADPAFLADLEVLDADPNGGRLSDNLRTVEEQRILDALRHGNGSRKQAAEALGISPRTLRYKIARLKQAGVQVP
jgi:two-component system response regulator FlrC